MNKESSWACPEERQYANVYKSENFDWYFLAVIESSELRAEVNELFKLIFGITIFLIIITLIVAVLLSRKISRPLESVADQSKKMAADDLRKSLLDDLIDVDYLKEADNNFIEERFSEVAGEMEEQWLERTDEIGVLARSYQAMKNNLISLLESLAAYGEEISQLNQKLKYQAFHDSLTKLPNRRRFINELEKELKQDGQGAVLLLDLDNFKEINDVLGHFYGDKVLKAVSKRLLSLKEEQIFVARYGGDEFLLLIKDANKEAVLNKSLEKVDVLFKAPFLAKSEAIDVNYSLGIALYPDDANNTDKLITMADTAMYQAKSLGKKYLYYNQKMKKDLKEKKRIKRILKDALANDDFMLKYQPQINSATGKADHLEALLRLKDYDISPAKFIPLAEKSNLIIKVGRWVTREAIKQLANWRDKELKLKSIAINFSVKQLKDEGYIDFIKQQLTKWDIEPGLIEIEITESILLNKEQEAIEYLTKLKELGLKIALDDFGTGYSSLNYLTYIELDKIKLDKALIDRFLNQGKVDIMDDLISLFHNFGLPIVAEGIEIKKQYEKLLAIDCDYIQGYLFSKPVEAKKIEESYEKNYIELLTNN